jgi:hypothetical protein
MKKSHLALAKKKGENKLKLPTQKPADICLCSTDTDWLTQVPNAKEYREGLVKFKAKYLTEIQDWSKRHGIEADVRVYLELKPLEG